MPGKYAMRRKEEKPAIVKHNLPGEGIRKLKGKPGFATSRSVGGPQRIEPKRSANWNRKNRAIHCLVMNDGKNLTYEEQLPYQMELLKRELLQKETEVPHLKNGATPEERDSTDGDRDSA